MAAATSATAMKPIMMYLFFLPDFGLEYVLLEAAPPFDFLRLLSGTTGSPLDCEDIDERFYNQLSPGVQI